MLGVKKTVLMGKGEGSRSENILHTRESEFCVEWWTLPSFEYKFVRMCVESCACVSMSFVS
jgi:hypothetical protein